MNEQKLREAMEIADALRDGINASHDWTVETERAEAFLRELAASKPEPQAQAGEPVKGYLHLKPPFEDENGNDISGEYITLQSHREAMARQKEKYASCFTQLLDAWEAIARKDAALDACVEALKEQRGDPDWHSRQMREAAIIKAEEARK